MSRENVTRRRFVAGGIAAGAAAAVPAAAAAKQHKPAKARTAPRKVDVVVVGAGLAGLAAARNVLKAGKSVALLEARKRVGGRVLNKELGGGKVVEIGGEFVGPTQNHVNALADELGVKRYPAYSDTLQSAYIADGKVTYYKGDIPPDTLGLVDLALLVTRLDQMAAQIPINEPWNAPNAQTLDSQTVETWIRANSVNQQRALELVQLFFNSAYGSRAMDISVLYTLAQVAGMGDEQNAGTIERGIGSKGGAQDSRLVGGSQQIAAKAAAQLGKRVVLGAPVRRIEQSQGLATVGTDEGVWKAKRVIVAVPPALAVEIDWHPLLPPQHDALRRRMTQGTLMKIHAVYPEPFWRKDPGVWMALKIGGTVPEMFDNTPQEGTPGILMGFHGGHAWRQYAGQPAERKKAVLSDFAEAFGSGALNPIDYFEQDWTKERWSRGCPVSAMGPGVVTDFLPILTQPFGRVHWAGTETATYWNGYMDGAVRSGERAASEVLSHL